MKKMKLQSLGFSLSDLLTREQLKKIYGASGSGGSGGDGGNGSGGDCNATCDGGKTKYICYDVMCVGARREVCSYGRPSGYNNCAPE